VFRPLTATHLLVEGVATEAATAAFLADVMAVADDHGFAVEGGSVLD
jgi:hypothetical protein